MNRQLSRDRSITTSLIWLFLLTMPLLVPGGLYQPGEAMAATISCSSGVSGCHFSPTVKDGSGRNVPTGLFTGSHARHSGYSTGSKRQYQYACTKCHPSVSTNNHQSGYKNITGSSLPGNRYSAGKSIANTNSPNFGNCGNIYCHSTGRASGMGQVQYSSVRWGGTEGCLGCHGGRSTVGPNYYPARSVGNFTLTTSHSQHLKYPSANINCQICHAKTTTNATTLKNFTGVQRHANGVRDVLFTNIAYASYTSYKSTESGSSANTRVCTNTSCHGGTTRSAWSAATNNTNHTCTHCHGVPTGINATVPNTEPFRRVFAPGWGSTGTSTDNIALNTNIRVGGHYVHLSSVYMKRLKCNECHLVPSTPFSSDTNHTLNTTRFNSGTLTFGQASSARMIGGATPGQLASFSGYTSGTAVKAATCSSVYCHGNRIKSGDTSGLNRKPSWNQNLTTGTPGATECARCHGNPPTAGTQAGTHSGYAATVSCSGCHAAVVDATGKIINKALHINGSVQATSGCTGCHGALVSADFVKPSRHVNNGTTTSIVTDYDCIVCHAEGVAQASGVARSDLHTGTGTTTGNVDLRNVDNVNQTQAGGASGTNYWPWPHRRASAPLAKGSANTTNRNNMDTFCLNCHDDNGASGIAVNNTNDGLLLSGLNTTVRTVTTVKGGTNANPNNATVAQRPFNTEDNLQNGNDAATSGGSGTIGTFRTSTYGRVLNVKSQFNSGNAVGTGWASHHNLNMYTKRYTSNNTAAGTGGIQTGAWTGYVTKESVTMNNAASGGAIAGLHCSDCHLNEVNAHGATNAWYMLMNVGTVAPFNETADTAPTLTGATGAATAMNCNLCHFNGAYSPTGTSTAVGHYPHNPRCQNVDVVTGTIIEAPFGNNCHGCHGGYGNTADTTNRDSIGTGTLKVGRGALGSIHGNNEDYNPGNGATVSKRYRFMSGATMRFYNPNGTTAYSGTANWQSTTAAGCYTVTGADTWAGGDCTQHGSGVDGQTKNSGRLLTY